MLGSVQVGDDHLGASGLRDVDLVRPVALADDDRPSGIGAMLQVVVKLGQHVARQALKDGRSCAWVRVRKASDSSAQAACEATLGLLTLFCDPALMKRSP